MVAGEDLVTCLSNPRLTAWWNRYVCSQPWMQRHECVSSHPHNIPALHVQLGHVYSHICHGPSTEGLGTPHHSTIECWQGQTCLHTCFVPTGPHGGWACLSAWLPRPSYAMWPCGMNTHLHTHCVTWQHRQAYPWTSMSQQCHAACKHACSHACRVNTIMRGVGTPIHVPTVSQCTIRLAAEA